MKLAGKGQLVAYRHDGYWQCMDTKREGQARRTLGQWAGAMEDLERLNSLTL